MIIVLKSNTKIFDKASIFNLILFQIELEKNPQIKLCICLLFLGCKSKEINNQETNITEGTGL